MHQGKIFYFSKIFLLVFALGEMYPIVATAADVTSVLLKKTPDGHLSPVPDAQGNIVPDFSWVGYRNGEVDIPEVPVVMTISPISDDNLKNIQDAVNTVSAMPLVNGFRGAILLKPGTYKISAPVKVTSSGIVIRGSGTGSSGTNVLATSTRQEEGVFIFSGNADIQLTGSSTNLRRKTVLDSYVPLGSRVLTVDSNHAFKPGDRVILRHTHNDAWIALIGMGQYGWTASSYTFDYKRVVMAVNGSKITIDAPVVDPVDKKYGNAEIIAYAWPGKIDNDGIENIRLDTVYSSSTDENHTWNGIKFINTENSWAKNVDVYHTGYAAVSVERSSSNITILDSKMIDPVSQITGSRRYSFNIAGQRNLVRGCYARYGRHDYVTSSRTAGPNVFTESQAINQQSDIGPHHRWATGTLFDSIVGDGAINVQNRISIGGGHGWAGAQTMLWNCSAKKIIIQSPPGFINWAIGSLATVTNTGIWVTVPGYKELTGQNAWPASLYEQQMCDRLGKFCSGNIVTVTAKNQLIVQGDPVPALTYSLSLNVTLNKNPVCSTAATEQSQAGSYEISCNGAEKTGYTFRYIPGTLTITPKMPANATLDVLPSSTSNTNCRNASDMLYIDGSTEGTIFSAANGFTVNLPAGQHTLALGSQASPIPAGGTLVGTCTGSINPKTITLTANTKTTAIFSYQYNAPNPVSLCKIISAKVDSQLNWGKIVNKFIVSVSYDTASAKFPVKLTGNVVMKNPFIQNFWADFSMTSSWSGNSGSFTGEIWKNNLTLQGYISNSSILSVGDNPLESLIINGSVCY